MTSRIGLAAVVCAALTGCSGGSDRGPQGPQLLGVVAFAAGGSTGPDTAGGPGGTAILTSSQVSKLGGVDPLTVAWLRGGSLAGVGAGNLVKVFKRGTQQRWIRAGGVRLPRRIWNQEFLSPAGTVATQSIVRTPCGPDQEGETCYAAGQKVIVSSLNGSKREFPLRGQLLGWLDGSHLVVRVGSSLYAESLTGRSWRPLVVPHGARLRSLIRRARSLAVSDDGSRLALIANPPSRRRGDALAVILRGSGRVVRVARPGSQISMIMWSPHQDMLAYTTSAFPAPHRVMLILPNGSLRTLWTSDRHVDWVAWMPDGRYLLLDDEPARAWRLLSVQVGRRRPVSYRRLGARPLPCCISPTTFSGQ